MVDVSGIDKNHYGRCVDFNLAKTGKDGDPPLRILPDNTVLEQNKSLA